MTVWLAHNVFGAMLEEGAAHQPFETGGILLGWRTDKDAVVVDMLGPGPGALHRLHSFEPNHEWQMEHKDRLFANSNGDLDYLGDWHTHPLGVAQMSWKDRRTLRHIAYKVETPLMVIIAGDFTCSSAVTCGCWAGTTAACLWGKRTIIAPEPTQLFEPPSGWPSAAQS